MNPVVRMRTKADEQIEEAIGRTKSFVLDAGAGSGKTRSLVTALRLLIDGETGRALARAGQKVACITFTNVAKEEIVERTAHSGIVQTSTIHEFLWGVIKPYQPALKRALLAHNLALEDVSKRKRDQKELEKALSTVDVLYQDRGAEFLEGRIFHDDLLEVARLLFKENPLMAKIAGAKFPYIFVDEYQDTSPAVVSILLEYILPANRNEIVVGFFGDKLQSIYDSGVGEIPNRLKADLVLIPKQENYRCSLAVIDLLNKIRTDIRQVPAGNNSQGAAVFIRLPAEAAQDIQTRARDFVSAKLGWDLSSGTQKDLFLTHSLIAKRAGYDGLLQVYAARGGFSRDQLLNGEDIQIRFFHAVTEALLSAWAEQDIGRVLSILRQNDFRVDEVNGKTKAKAALNRLAELAKSKSVGDVLRHLEQSQLVKLPDDLMRALEAKVGDRLKSNDPEAIEREEADRKFFADLLALDYGQISAFCGFLQEHTPFSTQHGVKGTEYDTVFFVLDDKGARWNNYSFDKYLSGEDEGAGKVERARRTRNLFYVCCSRSKNNLAVIDLGKGDPKKDARIKELFGAANCFF